MNPPSGPKSCPPAGRQSCTDHRTRIQLTVPAAHCRPTFCPGHRRLGQQGDEKAFSDAPTPDAMAALGEERLADYIKTIGSFVPRRRTPSPPATSFCHSMAARCHARARRWKRAGVGRKTANVVLNTAFGEPTIAVDTHIFRVSNRTGLAPERPACGGAEAAESGARTVPAGRTSLADPAWRYVCTARRPQCDRCLIVDLCEFKGQGDRLKRSTPLAPIPRQPTSMTVATALVSGRQVSPQLVEDARTPRHAEGRPGRRWWRPAFHDDGIFAPSRIRRSRSSACHPLHPGVRMRCRRHLQRARMAARWPGSSGNGDRRWLVPGLDGDGAPLLCCTSSPFPSTWANSRRFGLHFHGSNGQGAVWQSARLAGQGIAETQLRGAALETLLSAGVQPLGKKHRVSAVRGYDLLSIDGEPALDHLLDALPLPGANALR